MKRTTSQYTTITIITLLAIVTSLLVSLCTAPSATIMPSRGLRSQEAAKRRQDEEAMAAAILQKEKDAAKNDGLNEAEAVDKNLSPVPLPSVVSPPSAPNLTSLLTGHIGQEVEKQAADNGIATGKGSNTQSNEQVDDTMKPPKKKK